MPLLKTILTKIKEFEIKTEDTGWKDLTLINGWEYYSSGNQNPPQYCKKNGVVYLHGNIIAGSGTNTSNRNIAQLPQGFKPAGIINNLYYTSNIIVNGSRQISSIQITKAGIIMAPANLAEGNWFSLEGISFPAE